MSTCYKNLTPGFVFFFFFLRCHLPVPSGGALLWEVKPSFHERGTWGGFFGSLSLLFLDFTRLRCFLRHVWSSPAQEDCYSPVCFKTALHAKDWFSSFWDYHSMEMSETRKDKYWVTLNRGKKALWNYLLAPCFLRFCISGNKVTVCWHSLMCNDIIPGVWRQQEAQNQTYLSFHRKRRD